MADDGPLFDALKAEEAKQQAIFQAGDHASPVWKNKALRAVYAVCRRRLRDGSMEFTTDVVTQLLWQWGIPDPHEPRALGAVMRIAATRGWCRATDRYADSDAVSSHRRQKRVWRVLETIPEWDGKRDG